VSTREHVLRNSTYEPNNPSSLRDVTALASLRDVTALASLRDVTACFCVKGSKEYWALRDYQGSGVRVSIGSSVSQLGVLCS